MAELFWLSDAQWAAIEPLLPDLGGKPRVDDRRVISGILHRFREGLRWRAVPGAYGPRWTIGPTDGASEGCGSSCSRRSQPPTIRQRWQWWTALWFALIARPLVPKGGANQAIGRSRGGRTTKSTRLPTVTDGSTPCCYSGTGARINGARALLASTALPVCLIGDTAYDADDLRHFLTTQGCKPVMSLRPNRINKPDFDAEAYKQRNLIERAFCRIKDWRPMTLPFSVLRAANSVVVPCRL